jgi:prophage antirepressor-like protein
MSAVQLFNNGEFEIAVEFTDDAFRVHGMLVAEALGYRKGADLARTLPEHCKFKDTVSAGRTVGALTRPQDLGVWYLTEEGFYRAIGQRVSARIQDAVIRNRVERFQTWVFGEVLPAIRKRGHYSVIDDPQSLTWEQLSQLLYQRYGLKLSVTQITGALRAGGVLRQNGNPRSKYQDWFWLTDTGSVNVLDFHVPKIAARITETRGRMLERLQWHQLRLQLDGVPRADF